MRRPAPTEGGAATPAEAAEIFPIVVCYMPVFMIIALVPALISIFRAL